MFSSFFLAGFECTAARNAAGQWIDQVAATQHDRHLAADYERLRAIGITAVREGVRWPLVDHRGRYDLRSLRPTIRASRAQRIQVVYDLCHFGYPHDADPADPGFAARFADYAYAVTRHLAARSDAPPVLVPVNEPSYFAWAAGEAGLFAPHWRGRGPELKTILVRAAIAGIDAIWAACPEAVIVNVDALCRVVAPRAQPELAAAAARFNDGAVFESWDMLAGRRCPELGGSARHLGIIGANYYWTNQWELTRAGEPLPETDPRRWPLHRLLAGVWQRYRHPLLLSETSHVGAARADWLRAVAEEAAILLGDGIPLLGACVYPVLGMPEWHDREVWTSMGLWDLERDADGDLTRVPCAAAIAALRDAQRRVADAMSELVAPRRVRLAH